MRIIHVTTHLGGGVGRVVLNYLRAVSGCGDFALYCLDYANERAAVAARKMNLELYENVGLNYDFLGRAVSEADLVVIHWWNHPLMYSWLINGSWPAARVLIWGHVSGHLAPQVITPDLVDFPDLFALTTPHTLTSPALKGLSSEKQLEKLRIIFNCSGLDYVRAAPKPHKGFRIGYIGTVDYQKMHPDYLKMSLAAQIPEAVFVVVGGPLHKDLQAEIEALGAAGRFVVLGQIPEAEIPGILETLDVFGYPLNPEHYGALELALLEAQKAGVPPVVLAGGAEEFLVGDRQSGLVAATADDYPRKLELLYHDQALRAALAAAAPAYVEAKFSLAGTVAEFEKLYVELLRKPKRKPEFFTGPFQRPLKPHQLFLVSQGETAAEEYLRLMEGGSSPRLSRAAYSATRGSVFHYRDFLEDDGWLNDCCQRLALAEAGKGEFASGRDRP